MPYYYDVYRAHTTNSSANTCSWAIRLLTVANQPTMKIVGLIAASRFGTAGGGQIRLRTTATNTDGGGTSYTPAKRNSSNPTVNTTAFTDATAITAGGAVTEHISVGFAQTGGTGGWTALDGDHAMNLNANGGVNGAATVASFATTASVTMDITVEFSET